MTPIAPNPHFRGVLSSASSASRAPRAFRWRCRPSTQASTRRCARHPRRSGALIFAFIPWTMRRRSSTDEFAAAHHRFHGETLARPARTGAALEARARRDRRACRRSDGRSFTSRAVSTPESKQQVGAIAESLRSSLRARLERKSWMGDRNAARARWRNLSALTFKIGYPECWRDWSALATRRAFALRERRSRRARFDAAASGVARIDQPTDRRALADAAAERQCGLRPAAQRDRVSGGDPRAAVLRSRMRTHRSTTAASARSSPMR